MWVKPVVRTGLKHLLLFVAYGSTGALLALVVGYIALTVAQKPALQLWHRTVLDEEFTAGKAIRCGTSPLIGNSRTGYSCSCGARSTSELTSRLGLVESIRCW